jgi:hypothetical protein
LICTAGIQPRDHRCTPRPQPRTTVTRPARAPTTRRDGQRLTWNHGRGSPQQVSTPSQSFDEYPALFEIHPQSSKQPGATSARALESSQQRTMAPATQPGHTLDRRVNAWTSALICSRTTSRPQNNPGQPRPECWSRVSTGRGHQRRYCPRPLTALIVIPISQLRSVHIR